MIYDIRTRENAEKTLVGFTGIPFENWKAYEANGEFAEMAESLVDKIDLSDLFFRGTHITTSRNYCSDIKKYGLLGLDKIYNIEDSDFRKFLNENGVYINFEKKCISYNSKRIDFTDINSSEHTIFLLANRINNDFGTNIFLCMESYKSYPTNIHVRPEILKNIDQVFETNLSELWAKQSKPYRIEVKIGDYMLGEKLDVDELIYDAYFIADRGLAQHLLSLDTNVFVPKENIIEIAEI